MISQMEFPQKFPTFDVNFLDVRNLDFQLLWKIKQNLQTKKFQNYKKSQNSKYQGTARFLIRITLFIDFLYCYLNDFAVNIYKTTSGFTSNMSIKYMYKTSTFL